MAGSQANETKSGEGSDMIRSLPRSGSYNIGFIIYVVAFYIFLFAPPLFVTCVLAFNDSDFPALPWYGFSLDWFFFRHCTEDRFIQ